MKNEYGPPEHKFLGILGLRIRTVRVQKKLTQETLAQQAGLDRTYIGGVERGERNITVLSLKKIANALGIKASSLIES